MSIKYPNQNPCGYSSDPCPSKDGCPPGVCPDHIIRRHDNKPPFRVNVEDCDGPLDLTGHILEASMWVKGKFKTNIDAQGTYFALADNIGFEQVMVGDTIIVDHVRSPEHMTVVGFDEANYQILVRRGVNGTNPRIWKKGTPLRIFRFINAPAITEMSFEDVEQVDGTVLKDQLMTSFLTYEWNAQDTCLPGCFWLEFKLIKMKDGSFFLPGGYWNGTTNEADNGDTFTGSEHSNSSVLLSFNVKTGHYMLPKNTIWGGPTHVWTDEKVYTGTDHDDGSVMLDATGIPSADDFAYNSGISGISVDIDNTISNTPIISCEPVDVISSGAVSTVPLSFTEVCATPSDMGCELPSGVETIRRFPLQGEGFLIKIENTTTTDF